MPRCEPSSTSTTRPGAKTGASCQRPKPKPARCRAISSSSPTRPPRGARTAPPPRRYAGLAYLLCDEIYHQAHKRGYQWAEFSWTLEENRLINSLITKIGCTHYKTYRIYEKRL